MDYGQALIRHMLASINRDPEKTPKPYALKDFLTFTKPKERIEQLESPIKGLSMSEFILLKALEARNEK